MSLSVDVTYALSPQAKGKIERSYRWLQDRIVRTAAIEKLSTLDELRPVLKEEVFRYNHQRLHATTGEIPDIRFEKARRSGRTLFRPFSLPSPYSSPKDVFCLREKRTVNAYRRIEFYNHQIPLPKVPIGQEVPLNLEEHNQQLARHEYVHNYIRPRWALELKTPFQYYVQWKKIQKAKVSPMF
jgi:hypothetical protein